jgi:hypothetical protein
MWHFTGIFATAIMPNNLDYAITPRVWALQKAFCKMSFNIKIIIRGQRMLVIQSRLFVSLTFENNVVP